MDSQQRETAKTEALKMTLRLLAADRRCFLGTEHVWALDARTLGGNRVVSCPGCGLTAVIEAYGRQ